MQEWANRLLTEGPLVQNWPPLVLYLVVMVLSCLIVTVFIALYAMIAVWLERKVAGRIQSRYGPTYCGKKFGSVSDALSVPRPRCKMRKSMPSTSSSLSKFPCSIVTPVLP